MARFAASESRGRLGPTADYAMSDRSGMRTMRINLVLDEYVPGEALLLHRLATIPRSRQTSWLNSLLVKGFSAECAEIQALQPGRDESIRYIPHDPSAERVAGADDSSSGPSPTPKKRAVANRPSDQPVALASLKAVVG